MVPPYICVRRRTAMRLKPKYAHDAIQSVDNTSSPEGWIRDLTEEGIEPNPGPRYISKNINGMSNLQHAGRIYMKVMQSHQRKPITAVFIQEHNIKADAVQAHVDMAHDHNLIMVVAPCPNNKPKGGTAILIPTSALEIPPGSNYSATYHRLANSVRVLQSGRAAAVTMQVEGTHTRLVSAYAHADGQAASRPNFFTVTLRSLVNKNTVMGIDANCVLNEALDLKRTGHTPYNNTGATELAQLIADCELADVARECLGDQEFYTSHHNTPGGVTHTRIDQLFAPTRDALTWDHIPVKEDIFPRKQGARQLDHEMIEITVTEITGTRGKDVQTIDEEIYQEGDFLRRLVDTMNFTIEQADPDTNGTWTQTWMRIKQIVLAASVKETQERRKKYNADLKPKIAQRDALKQKIDDGSADPLEITRYMDIQEEIRAAKAKPSMHNSLESIAYSMGKKHDVGSAAFYRPFTPKGPATWVDAVQEADWTDLNNPTLSGRMIRDPKAAGKEISKYWRKLYAKQPHQPGHLAARNECLDLLRQGNQVQPPTAERCGAAIKHAEVRDVCNHLPTGKSSGPDRIPNKFYKVLSKYIAPILTKVYNECHATGSFPDDFASGWVTTMYKKNARSDPRNYRPITLLNGDYKILMRILAIRMNEAVRQFVSPQQNGFTPDSFLPENIMLLKLIQAYLDNEDSEAADEAFFLFLDMEKAFDRCSWEFLLDALPAVGFGPDFIAYIKLMYSETRPPNRTLLINGYLADPFPITAGVAQGCPLSPLLFLLITEPLTRLFQKDTQLKGVTIDGIRHLISQYADDTTLILQRTDADRAQALLKKWEKATAMHENEPKREGLLLGSLRTNPQNAPNIVRRWTPDGESIRALGVPIGNDFSEVDWWMGKYRQVKARVARWPSLRRLSVQGRNMLLQAVYYGMFRFWLYAMVLPSSVIKLMEEDAKQILWAHVPHLDGTAEGSARCRRWMREYVSYKPVTKGGAGIMHWPSHCDAYYSTWIVRYLDPRRAPWKSVMSWFIRDDVIGDAILLSSSPDRNRHDSLPTGARYMRRCMISFHGLNLEQDTSMLDYTVQAEPLWHNRRFTIKDVPPVRQERWEERYDTNRILSLLDPRSRPFTLQQWKGFFLNMAPQRLQRSPAYWDEEKTLVWELQRIQQAVPQAVLDAAKHKDPADGQTVSIIGPDQTHTYADVEATDLGLVYHELWLDMSNRPHPTGRQLPDPPARAVITPVESWDESPPSDDDEPAQEEDDEPPPFPAPRPAIIGPATLSFPRNDGWYLPHQSPRKENGTPRKLSDLTISKLTKYHTSFFSDNAAPTCITTWQPYVGSNIPFDKVFASLGTPLSDATEERHYRKLLHRGTFVRNRDKSAPDHSCRLCGISEETIMHLFKCEQTKPLWAKCIGFCETVLGYDRPIRVPEAIIFGLQNKVKGTLYGEDALAFLRHAYGQFYHDFANVDLKGASFHPQLTFANALKSFRSAVLRYGMEHRILWKTRYMTNLVDTAPEASRERFSKLICIETEGAFMLEDEFVAAVAEAEREVENYFGSNHAHRPNQRA